MVSTSTFVPSMGLPPISPCSPLPLDLSSGRLLLAGSGCVILTFETDWLSDLEQVSDLSFSGPQGLIVSRD